MNCTSVLVVGAGAVGAVVGAPLVVSALGFTTAGIAAGSFASWLMSTTAVAGGGGVAAGGFIAVLQSVGAAGFSVAGKAVLAATGGTVAGVVGCLTTY